MATSKTEEPNTRIIETHCPGCHNRLTLCRLIDVNGNRHVWRWCQPCHRAVQCTLANERPQNLDIDALPLCISARERIRTRNARRNNPISLTSDRWSGDCHTCNNSLIACRYQQANYNTIYTFWCDRCKEQRGQITKAQLKARGVKTKTLPFFRAPLLKDPPLRSGKTKSPRTRLDKFAAQMRRSPTPIERKLWRFIRDGRVHGIEFEMQVPLHGFILDFYAPSLKLCVEADGKEWHDAERDSRRDRILKNYGIATIRFTGSDIMRDPVDCVRELSEMMVRVRGDLKNMPIDYPEERRWRPGKPRTQAEIEISELEAHLDSICREY